MSPNELLAHIVASNLRDNDEEFDFTDNINVVLMCSLINKIKMNTYAKVEDNVIMLLIANSDNTVKEKTEITYHFLEEYFVE